MRFKLPILLVVFSGPGFSQPPDGDVVQQRPLAEELAAFNQEQVQKLDQAIAALRIQKAEFIKQSKQADLDQLARETPGGLEVLPTLKRIYKERKELILTDKEKNNPEAVRLLLRILFPNQLKTPDVPLEDALLQSTLADLGSAEFHKRDQAHRRLIKAGPAIFPKVIARLNDPDPEVQTRMRSIVGVWASTERSTQSLQYHEFAGGLRQMFLSMEPKTEGLDAVMEDMSTLLRTFPTKQDKEARFEKLVVGRLIQSASTQHVNQAVARCLVPDDPRTATLFSHAAEQASEAVRMRLLNSALSSQHERLMRTALSKLTEEDTSLKPRIVQIIQEKGPLSDVAMQVALRVFKDYQYLTLLYKAAASEDLEERYEATRLLVLVVKQTKKVTPEMLGIAKAGLLHEEDTIKKLSIHLLSVPPTVEHTKLVLDCFFNDPESLLGPVRQLVGKAPALLQAELDALSSEIREADGNSKMAVAYLEKWLKQSMKKKPKLDE